LVLASVSSPLTRVVERLAATAKATASRSQRRVLELPEDDPPPGVLARLVEELEADEDRSVVPYGSSGCRWPAHAFQGGGIDLGA